MYRCKPRSERFTLRAEGCFEATRRHPPSRAVLAGRFTGASYSTHRSSPASGRTLMSTETKEVAMDVREIDEPVQREVDERDEIDLDNDFLDLLRWRPPGNDGDS